MTAFRSPVDKLVNLTDVNTTGATDGQTLAKSGTTWLPASTVKTGPATTADNVVTASAATVTPLTLKGAASHTADLLQLQDSMGAVKTSFGPTGQLTLSFPGSNGPALNLTGSDAFIAARQGTNAGNAVWASRLSADTYDRLFILYNGQISWGPGNITPDTNLYRAAAGLLRSDGGLSLRNVDFSTGLQLVSTTASSTLSPNLILSDNQATPQSIYLRKQGTLLVVLDNAGNQKFTFDTSNGAMGFYGGAAVARQTVTGSRGGNAALASLLNALSNIGLLTDSTTA